MATGSLAANGDPLLDIEVIGAYGQPTTFTCVIDTGFTGFLSIPLIQAFPIGLILAGTTSITLANGATEPKLFCVGKARIGNSEKWGVIVIENQSNQVLLGMDFLKEFGYKLLVCPTSGGVEIVPATDGFTIPAGRAVPAVGIPALTAAATPVAAPAPTSADPPPSAN